MSVESCDVLIVEDEQKIASLLQDYLQQSAFSTQIIDNGLVVIPWLKSNNAKLVLLDLMLPGKDGMEICRELREFSQVPVIMVTARVEEIDRLLGLEFGADDYMCKPFSPREVVARVKAVMRRSYGTGQTPSQEQRLNIDPAQHIASYQGITLDLTPIEFRLLQVFHEQPGRVFSRDRLMDVIYTDHRVVTGRTVDSHVKNLRKKLLAINPENDLIRSIYGIGYRMD